MAGTSFSNYLRVPCGMIVMDLAVIWGMSVQIAVKQLAGVGAVLLSIGDRRADPLKRFIKNGDSRRDRRL